MKKINASVFQTESEDRLISLDEETLYPHLKITNEKFPRLLVTRKIADDGAEYFGAFLPATGVRLWLEFINRTFRLRTCRIEIDGKFPSPCTQFYVKRCIAPCVESLCGRAEYLEMVELVRLFLRNEREKFAEVVIGKIEAAAAELKFEEAAKWRDILRQTLEVFESKDWNLWLDNAVDTFEIKEQDGNILVLLVTQRGRKTLGKKIFVFEGQTEGREVLAQVISRFYKFHAPREIRIPFDLPQRKTLAKFLSEREYHPVKFTIIKEENPRKTSLYALKRARFDFDFRQIKPPVKIEDIKLEMKKLFALKKLPQTIEAFDAAHISGTDFTAAKTVWRKGKFEISENEFWLSDEKSEIAVLQKAVAGRFAAKKNSFLDLLLIDGGKSQMQAVLKSLEFLKNRKFKVICAVKPPQKHNEISHFLSETGERVEFSNTSEAMRVLLRLRDEAHDLTNLVHRLRRETSHFYELAQMLPSLNESERRLLLQKFGSLKILSQASENELKNVFEDGKIALVLNDLKVFSANPQTQAKPLIVPIRFDDPNGEARDLQPLGYTKI